jgi:hypothetical protein
MAKKLSINSVIAVVFAVFFFHSITAFAAQSGRWEGKAEFGKLEFTIGLNGSQFETITYYFTKLNCDGTDISGDHTTIFDPPWKISGSSFSFSVELEPGVSMRMAGTFVSSTAAGGNWQITAAGGSGCQGFWDATFDDSGQSVDHAFVKGVYWSPEELPGWGFFADVQEETFFGAVYGYMDQDSTFITLQGSLLSTFPMIFRGDVFFLSNGGTMASDVGDFNWAVGDSEAAPMATLTITSNILNATDLELIRFSYAEKDRVDMITGGDWNITRRSSDGTSGNLYGITDERVIEDEITYATVINREESGKRGTVGYFPDDDGDYFGMMVDFGSTSEVFYMFLATNANMYGQYWILDPGQQPSGSGDHFRASADTMQQDDLDGSISEAKMKSLHQATSRQLYASENDTEALELLRHRDSHADSEPLFEESRVLEIFEQLSRVKRDY